RFADLAAGTAPEMAGRPARRQRLPAAVAEARPASVRLPAVRAAHCGPNYQTRPEASHTSRPRLPLLATPAVARLNRGSAPRGLRAGDRGMRWINCDPRTGSNREETLRGTPFGPARETVLRTRSRCAVLPANTTTPPTGGY